MRNHDSEIYHWVNFKKTEEIAIANRWDHFLTALHLCKTFKG